MSTETKSTSLKKLDFSVSIQAPAQKVWQILWNDITYRQWTSAFSEGSYAVTDWKENSKVHFLTPAGEGMFSIIAKSKENELMTFKHLGTIKDFKEQPEDEETKKWSGCEESYQLKENNGTTTLTVSIDVVEEHSDYFTNTFPKALGIVKGLAERTIPVAVTIETTVAVPVTKVWKLWTTPEDICKWNNASDDWHTTRAENDLRTGGKFTSRMEAKDGSMGFDFWGTHDEVKTNEVIVSTMGDGRKMKVTFSPAGNTTRVVETFDAETENSVEMQRGGWQNILNSFKKYAEANV